jgi:hypothetical protein
MGLQMSTVKKEMVGWPSAVSDDLVQSVNQKICEWWHLTTFMFISSNVTHCSLRDYPHVSHFWNIMLYNPGTVNWHFGGIYYLSFQCRCTTEDGYHMFLRNLSRILSRIFQKKELFTATVRTSNRTYIINILRALDFLITVLLLTALKYKC